MEATEEAGDRRYGEESVMDTAIGHVHAKRHDPVPKPLRIMGVYVTLTLGVLVAPVVSEAQVQTNIPRVGVLEPGSSLRAAEASRCLTGFQQGLRDLGYVEGHNIILDYRYAEAQPERFSTLAADLVRLTPDVIGTHSGRMALVAKQVITTVPVVIGVASDLVTEGIVASLAQPGGNITGLELRDLDLVGKRLELLKEAVPTIARIAVLVDPAIRYHAQVPGNIEMETRALGVP
jgi:putative ABC transport system substrate-binding protein